MQGFGKYEYKKATTDEIVKQAGISKGLLYHYFSSKKVLYLELYEYCVDYMMQIIEERSDMWETDFITLLQNSQMIKLGVIKQYSAMFDFLMKAYYEISPDVSKQVICQSKRLADHGV